MAGIESSKQRILDLRAAGQSPAAIAKQVGCTRSGVRHALRRWDAEPVNEPVPPSRERDLLKRRVKHLEQQQAVLHELGEAIKQAAAEVAFNPQPPRMVAAPKRGPRWSDAVDVVLHVSDLQYGEVVHPNEVDGGFYSPDVFMQERLPRWLDAVQALLETTASEHPIGTVWIAQGGDFVEGDKVFKGQEWHLAMDAGRQVATLAPAWAEAVATTARMAKSLGARSVCVPCVVGNHGVNGGRSAGATPHSLNYDYLLYEMVYHILAGMPDRGGVDWYRREARGAEYFDAQGHLFLMTHGQQDIGGGIVGVPVVNGTKNDQALRLQTGVSHQYHIVGHFHRPTSITVGGDSEKLWNGDWCGANNLSVGRGGGSEPSQRCYVVHPEYSICREWKIRLAPGSSRAALDIVRAGGSE